MREYHRLNEQTGQRVNIIAVEKVDPSEVQKYGIVSLGAVEGRVWPVTGMVEKPKPVDAPSDLMILGRYILQPEIFDILSDQEPGAGGEIQITDAMLKLMESQTFYAYEHGGKSYDCGSKLGFLEANIAYALDHPDMAERVRAEIKRIAGTLE